MMTRSDKAEAVRGLVEKFGKAKATFVVDFKGMKVEQVTSLRKKLNPVECEMQVVRNTLAAKALEQFPQVEKILSRILRGTNAIVFAYGDVTASAKVLSTFAKDVELLQLKMGVMDNSALDPEKIKYLATLPSKDILRGQLLGLFQAPMSKFVRTLNAVPSGFAIVLGAHKDKLEEN